METLIRNQNEKNEGKWIFFAFQQLRFNKLHSHLPVSEVKTTQLRKKCSK